MTENCGCNSSSSCLSPITPTKPNDVKIQYSTLISGGTWYNVWTAGRSYIRFSTDGGRTWSAGELFCGTSGTGSGVLYAHNITAVMSSTTSDTYLKFNNNGTGNDVEYTLPANTIVNPGDQLEIEASFGLTRNNANERVSVEIGTEIDSGYLSYLEFFTQTPNNNLTTFVKANIKVNVYDVANGIVWTDCMWTIVGTNETYCTPNYVTTSIDFTSPMDIFPKCRATSPLAVGNIFCTSFVVKLNKI